MDFSFFEILIKMPFGIKGVRKVGGGDGIPFEGVVQPLVMEFEGAFQ